MDDKALIERYWARDEAAIRQTAAKYGRLCFSIAGNILRSPEDCEECVSDITNGARITDFIRADALIVDVLLKSSNEVSNIFFCSACLDRINDFACDLFSLLIVLKCGNCAFD